MTTVEQQQLKKTKNALLLGVSKTVVLHISISPPVQLHCIYHEHTEQK